MIKVKGFYSAPKLANNLDKATAVFGELSQYASSFSRDYKTYTKGTSQISFCSFSSKDSGNSIELSTTYAMGACDVGDWAYVIGAQITNTNTKDDFIQMMFNFFTNRVKSIKCGELISDGSLRMPAWISWETDVQAVPHYYKIWLTGASFEAEYDEFQIIVVPPVDRIDKLFQPYPDLLVELGKNDMGVIHNRILTLRDRIPETIIYTEMVELIDKTNTNNRTQVGWTVLVYGPAGNTSDHIKDAIITYITSNSTSTESEWRALMPDLFNSTCFYIYPRWDKFAILPRLAMPGIYSPVVNSMENFLYVKAKTAAYISTPHLETNLECTIHRYKDISLAIVGGQFNRLNLFKFTDYFSDYNAQESLSEDFNRQKQETKDITNLLTLLLKKIDNWEKDSTLPVTVRTIEKYNQKFLVCKYSNVEYYVLMKPTHQP